MEFIELSYSSVREEGLRRTASSGSRSLSASSCFLHLSAVSPYFYLDLTLVKLAAIILLLLSRARTERLLLSRWFDSEIVCCWKDKVGCTYLCDLWVCGQSDRARSVISGDRRRNLLDVKRETHLAVCIKLE
jgi:hypothetical protein